MPTTVNYPPDVTDTTPTFLVGGDLGASVPAKAPCGPAGLAVLAAATPTLAQQAIGLGTPVATSTNLTLLSSHNGSTVVVTGTAVITVNTGLGSGFGLTIAQGTVSFNGSATVTDRRVTGATDPICTLLCLGTDTYGVYGAKA